jgi:ubiquinone/menaquinone biosynthesis C-methylase UbiE
MSTSRDRASKSSNPWLAIPLEDYERHMALPSIGQAQMLAQQLKWLMSEYRPRDLAVIGCAGGNGFEHIAADAVQRVVAVDINRQYLEQTAARHGGRLPGLKLQCGDLGAGELTFEAVDLIYAALIFEYVRVPAALITLRRVCRPQGTLAALLQLADGHRPSISGSPYQSLQSLAPSMTLQDPAEVRLAAAEAGFALYDSRRITLPSGKQFCRMLFRAS